jgi:lysozyme family protein
MSPIWKSAALPTLATYDMFQQAADIMRCDPAAVEAVWLTESSGKPFRADGSLERRFEPHHMPGSTLSWRDSLAIPAKQREAMFADAYALHPDAALRASSWGGPQIMGFNARAAGYASAADMVTAMAASEDAQIEAFVTLARSWKLDSAFRAKDWLAIAKVWNGNGQPEVYARKMEANYRRATGTSTPVVLRVGDRGPAVKRLQTALGCAPDGAFGPGTAAAVEKFQKNNGLAADGVVGAKTWELLERVRDAKPIAKETPVEAAATKTENVAAAVASGVAALEGVRRVLPPNLYELALYAALAVGFVATVSWLIRQARK